MLLDQPEAADLSGVDAPGESSLGAVVIVVCNSCRYPEASETSPRPGVLLVGDASRAAEGSGVAVKEVACLGNCKQGLSAAILRDGAWSYLFGRLDTASGADLVAGARLFAASTDQFLPFRERPPSLKRGMIARIPPFAALKDLT